MNSIFKPFGDFINNYMGKYTACLLEYGELPSFSAQNPSPVEEDSECNKKFADATLTAGRPPVNSGKGSGSDSSKSNKGSGSSDSSDSSSSSSSNSTYAGSNSRRGGSYINRRRPSSGVEGGSKAANGKVVEIALDGGANGGFFRASNNNTRSIGPGRKISSIAITGLTDEEKKKLAKKADGTGKTIVTNDGISQPPKKTIVKKPEAKVEIQEEKPLTIGNFIRYLFIACIVIALVIFIGGQALQMSKSLEK
ncbi:hypothetical protein [Bdellovibrio reynosensis]|uniref:Uncharacterized protein n=1 Tax=Bdellovibrio reynosensis TaxID=2835041 RepID=A0ABY4C6C3_9BACT|nr:hypothetical protein [Bdellovibrio reynosensis]UOF00470.1 hypothetical protein MNR06_12250 [Bdellovibrio reynosensis]